MNLSSNKHQSTSHESSNSSHSQAYKLAVLDQDNAVSEDDLLVKRFNNLLDQLENICSEDRDKIVAMTFKTKQLLAERWVNESMVKIMEGMILLHN